MIQKKDGLVRWEDSADQILRRFKGCAGWPGTFTMFRGAHLKILRMEVSDVVESISVPPGIVVKAQGNSLEVACGKGCVLIHEVVPESHRRMDIRSFLSGHRVCPGDRLGV
jgi:methionyl-tRNA formyltransferase